MAVRSYYRAPSFSFCVESDIPEASARLAVLLAPFAAEPLQPAATFRLRHRPEAAAPYLAYLGRTLMMRAVSYDRLVDYVIWQVTHGVEETGEYLAVHAAAASLDGMGFLFPAPREAGKTTLVAGLATAGFAYLTDEAALIEPSTLTLQPFPRPLWMREESLVHVPGLLDRLGPVVPDRGGHVPVAPADLPNGTIGTACPVRYVVLPQYRAGAPTVLEPIRRAQAAMAVVTSSFNFARFGADTGLDLVARVVRGADCYRLTTGTLADAVRLLHDLAAVGATDRPPG
jgi:hypothetical protein